MAVEQAEADVVVSIVNQPTMRIPLATTMDFPVVTELWRMETPIRPPKDVHPVMETAADDAAATLTETPQKANAREGFSNAAVEPAEG